MEIISMRPLRAPFLCVTLLFACGPTQTPDSTLDFSSGEHVILGDQGYRRACENRGGLCPTVLVRADGKQSFSYGELVAFSGDFYANPEGIYEEKVEPFLKWNRNDVNDVKGRFQKEVETIENFLHGHSEEAYPDFNISYAWNYPDYLNLALANEAHFGFYNMLAYVKYHARAVDLALEAHALASTDSSRSQRLFTQALFMNAFADHFLTDGFASGHIRDPRVQILQWGRANGISDRAAGTLAKVIHDRDGEVRVSGEHGLQVSNARGDSWLTRCDSQLFWNNTMEDPSIVVPVRAVEASLREVLEAYDNGTAVTGVYAATELVPFPSRAERRLIELFPKDMPEAEYDKIMKQMAFYTRIKAFSGVDKTVLKNLTASLPGIMRNFRNDVQGEILRDPNLTQRLPQAYLDAYMMIE
jgi:hypothetical protein